MGVAASQEARRAMEASGASEESLVIGPVRKPSEPMVVFYQLGRKFVDNENSIPKDSSDILYYTLAVGHHTGVIDCFDEKLSCTRPCFERVCSLLPEGDAARSKLEYLLESGEIQVDKESVGKLDEPIKEALAEAERQAGEDDGDELDVQARDWLAAFSGCLDAIKRDPALYLMGRVRLP